MTTQPATNPKKRSLMPSTPLRRRLRGHGHALVSIVHVGKEGVTPGLATHLKQVLFDHELVKVKIETESPQDRFAVADALAEEPGVSIVQILGRTILLYKRHPQEPQFEGQKGKHATPDPDAHPDPKVKKKSHRLR
jgi:RNA-binding protein